MNRNSLFFILKPFSSPLIHSYIVLFYLLARNISCSPDPKFVACQPKTCGNNQSISYPFYIEGTQESFCGYPSFGISCSPNGFPILNLSNTQHIIHQIFYQNQSLRVSNAAFSISRPNTTKGCLPRTGNLTLPPSNVFHLAPNQKDMILFYGCELLPSLQEHTVGCSAENETSSVVALYKEDKNLTSVSKNCKREVVHTVVEDGIGGIQEALRKGFLLNWSASDCSQCNITGGRCGFDSDMYTFRCYCTDRFHSVKCDDDPEKTKKKNKMPIVATGQRSSLPFLFCLGGRIQPIRLLWSF
ncbi:serine/threonine-protein kinase [Spatholobus suberectus]|nr:serine/threonine-protein kinase [Spatholobus suberectus]